MNHRSGDSSSTSKSPSFCKNNSNSRRKLSVLVVDDDALIRRIHKELMNKLGMEPQVAENGKDAVELCRSGMHFDLILMDMEMPIMDGPKATRELRAMGVKSKIVGVTSRDLESEKQAFLGAGLDDCLEKPLNSQKVDSLIKSFPLKNNQP